MLVLTSSLPHLIYESHIQTISNYVTDRYCKQLFIIPISYHVTHPRLSLIGQITKTTYKMYNFKKKKSELQTKQRHA